MLHKLILYAKHDNDYIVSIVDSLNFDDQIEAIECLGIGKMTELKKQKIISLLSHGQASVREAAIYACQHGNLIFELKESLAKIAVSDIELKVREAARRALE